MQRDILEGKWRQLRGQIREKWGKLTDDDLERAQGRWDRIVGLLQERYGYARQQAEAELDAFLMKVAPKEKETPQVKA